jgi:anti-sigma regulatory factor (Ser/Thr protein kinase)
MTMTWEIDRSLERPAEAYAARRLVDGAARNLSADRLDDARLVVTELVTNAVRHGTAKGPVHVMLRWDGLMLRLEVRSSGPFTRSLGSLGKPDFPPTGLVDAPDRVGGWGLQLIDALADRWGIETDGDTLVWAEIAGPDLGRPDQRDAV